MTRCPSCSEEVPTNARFCLNCGERLPQPAADGDIVAIRSTVIKAGTVTLGAEADGGECPICGRHNARTATFRCKRCERPLICTSHQDPQLLLCSDCVNEQRQKPKSVTVASDGSGDSPTLEDAVAQCVPGETINLMAGVYRLDTPLIISQSLTLVGAGMEQTSIVCDAEDFIVRFAGPGRFTAKGIAFCHEGAEPANGVEISGGTVNLFQCRFAGCVGDEELKTYGGGLLICGDARGLVSNCVMEGNDIGVGIKNGAQPTLEANYCRANKQGIRYDDKAGGVARKNECTENEACGIIVIGGNPTLEANTCRRNLYGGIILLAGSALVRGNECVENGVSGIEVSDGCPTLEGNICCTNQDDGICYMGGGGVARRNNCSENRRAGIYVSSSNAALQVESNTCRNNKGSGIRYGSEAGELLRGNDCSENEGDGIAVENGRPTVQENVCSQNGRYGIWAISFAKPMVTGNRCIGNASGAMWIGSWEE